MPDISNMESAVMRGHARFERWRRRFEGRMFKPISDVMLAEMWANLPAERKAELQAAYPEMYAKVDKLLGGGDGSTQVQTE